MRFRPDRILKYRVTWQTDFPKGSSRRRSLPNSGHRYRGGVKCPTAGASARDRWPVTHASAFNGSANGRECRAAIRVPKTYRKSGFLRPWNCIRSEAGMFATDSWRCGI